MKKLTKKQIDKRDQFLEKIIAENPSLQVKLTLKATDGKFEERPITMTLPIRDLVHSIAVRNAISVMGTYNAMKSERGKEKGKKSGKSRKEKSPKKEYLKFRTSNVATIDRPESEKISAFKKWYKKEHGTECKTRDNTFYTYPTKK